MPVLVFGDKQAVNVAGYVAAISGHEVILSSPERTDVRAVQVQGELIEVSISHADAGEVVDRPFDSAIIITESRKLRALIEPQRHLLSGKPLLLAPGGFGGVLRVKRWFEEWGIVPPRVAEAPGFPVSGTVRDAVLWSHTLKHSLPVAADAQGETEALLGIFSALLPELVASDLQTTSLSNTNHMIHPSVVLLNAIRVENGEEFSFYRSGISPAVGRLIESVDHERVEIARQIGAEPLNVCEWMLRFYGDEGMHGDSIIECLSGFPNFDHVPSPPGLDYRYVGDDVPYGVAQWAALAHQLGIKTPAMDGLLNNLGNLSAGTPFEAEQETAELFQEFLAITKGVAL